MGEHLVALQGAPAAALEAAKNYNSMGMIRSINNAGRIIRSIFIAWSNNAGRPVLCAGGGKETENQNYHLHPHCRAPCMKYYEGSMRQIYMYSPRKYVIPGR